MQLYCTIVWYLRWGVELPVECERESPHRPVTVVARPVLAHYLEINISRTLIQLVSGAAETASQFREHSTILTQLRAIDDKMILLLDI